MIVLQIMAGFFLGSIITAGTSYMIWLTLKFVEDIKEVWRKLCA